MTLWISESAGHSAICTRSMLKLILFLVQLLWNLVLVDGHTATIGKDVAAMAASVTLPNGSPCDFSSQCLTGSYCGENKCRKASCRHNFECNSGELCHFGHVDGELRSACFAFSLEKTKSNRSLRIRCFYFCLADFCSGGGRPTLNSGGFIETCNLEVPCVGSRSICNPIYGICCTKLRTCPFPRQPVLESETHRPVICQLRGGRQLECPPESECIRATGFCCAYEQNHNLQPPPFPTVELPQPDRQLPRPGEQCEVKDDPCSGNAVCECEENGDCECKCSHAMGYTLDESRRICRRMKRRLKEKCKFDLECQSAFSECSSGGCRCKSGFQRDGRGGCKPVSYRCVNSAEPMKYDGRVIACISEKNGQEIAATELLLNDAEDKNTTNIRTKRETRECPSQHYCVGIFDIPKKPHLIQGFCCPLPQPERPVCPVGNAHSTSQPPDYGCDECPWNFFCHEDGVATQKKICCPKPCLSPEDVYIKGQCYAHNEQCVGKLQNQNDRESEYVDSEIAEMNCIENVCGCPSGFLHVNGVCRHMTCTVGLRSEPSLDSAGRVIHCDRNSDCSSGHMCDPHLQLCCKGQDRCPKGYAETGKLCEDNNVCPSADQVCVRSRKQQKQRICCKLED
ncbi:EB domain-containing protein [Aphelenchoides besseyi]|nr:EB domain-containing protein [Aphelenchoides besseyi]